MVHPAAGVSASPPDATLFDTIVVGGGSSGSVIAARLSERANHSVLLIEAGPDPEGERQAAEAWPRDIRDGRFNSMKVHDWGFRHSPTRGQFEMPLPRGRVMGGSSSVNTCIALRGTVEDYDEWGAVGCEGWSWDACLPYFKRLERDLDAGTPGVDVVWHGTDGPLPIKRPQANELSNWQRAFNAACDVAGFPACADTNAPGATGHGVHAFNRIAGERQNAARSYLTTSVRARPNLTIAANTLVRRVLFDGRQACGVEVETKGEVRTIQSRRVVLCGGAIATPGVLLRSGVGPEASVRRIGVEPLAENPAVGARLLDHPGAALFFVPIRPGVVDFSVPMIQNVLRTRSKVSGLLNDILIQSGAYMHLPLTRLPLVTLMAGVGKSRGHGTLTYESADPQARPRIESKLIEHPDDRARLVEGLELAQELSRLPPMRRLARQVWPRGAIRDVIEGVTGSGYHPCGTVPMGRDSDPNAATDARGRVKGVSGLFVGDASLMPTIPTANIHLATLMIGERMGEWLRED
jgi:choline dehydrogenase